MTTRRAFLAAIAAALAGPKLLPAAPPGPLARLAAAAPASPMHNLALARVTFTREAFKSAIQKVRDTRVK